MGASVDQWIWRRLAHEILKSMDPPACFTLTLVVSAFAEVLKHEM